MNIQLIIDGVQYACTPISGQAAPQPVPQPPPQSTPQPVPQTVPPPASGADFFDWTGEVFKEQQVAPSYGNPVVGNGDRGGCIRIFADSAKYPFGVIVQFYNTTEPINPEQSVISPYPYDYSNAYPKSEAQIGSSGAIAIRFGTPATSDPHDCSIPANQYAYINFRENMNPPGTAHLVFNFTARTS